MVNEISRIVPVDKWTEDGIEDCLDCPETLCEKYCNGPDSLPKALEIAEKSKNIELIKLLKD